MLAVLYLALAILAGTLGLRRVVPAACRFNRAEELAGGVVLGTLLSSWLPFILAYVFGFNQGTMWLALALTAAGAALLAREERLAAAAAPSPLEAHAPPGDWGFIAVFGVVAVAFAYLFFTHLLPEVKSDLYSGGSVWGDLAVHLSIITSLVYGDNFPPENPVYNGYPLGYHFMPDFQSAGLMLLGFNLRWSLLLPSVLISAALVALVYHFIRRFAGHRWSPVLASILFWCNGGLGFLYVLDEKRGSPLGWWSFLASSTHNANLNETANIQWVNFICDIFLPQRASLFGFSMGVLVLILLYCGLDEGRRPMPERRSLFALAGVIVGLLPLMHTSSFPTLMLLSAGWAVLTLPVWNLSEFKQALFGCWIWFYLPALLLMAPQAILFIIPQVDQGSGHFIRFNLDWVNKGDPWVWFWLKNVGVTFLLLPAAIGRTDSRRWRLYIPFLLLFAGLEFVSMQPNAYDNLKYYLYWYIVSVALVGDLLAELIEDAPAGTYLTAALVVLGSVSGTLAIARDMATHFQMFSSQDVAIAQAVRERTPPRAIFLTSDLHRHPVPCLAGRRVVMGYKGWLWTWGFSYAQRDEEIARIYSGDPRAGALLRKYQVDYVYLGPSERDKLHPNEQYWREHYPVFYRSPGGDTIIYRVNPAAHTP